MTTKTSAYEEAIRVELRKLSLSPSHSFEHIDTVLSYALALQTTYGGDPDVITASALLHDLGRNDPQYRGVESALQSVRKARTLLESVHFPEQKIAATLQAISEHDQPEVHPATLEGRILKDADFLAGFGAVGVVRSAMWTAETGGSMQDLLERLEQKMKARFLSLELAQSRALGMRQYVFVRLFVEQLQALPAATALPSVPYIFIEGISGSGKSTQATLLSQRYQQEGVTPVMLHEPTPWFSQTRNVLGEQRRDPYAQLLLLLTDRYLHVRTQVEEALDAGKPVISDRSYLSSMVYQGGEGMLSPANVAYLHTILPQPTYIFLLDTDPHKAIDRVNARIAAEGTKLGEHETIAQLTLHRQRFLSLTNIFPHMHIISADEHTVDEIHTQIWTTVNHEK